MILTTTAEAAADSAGNQDSRVEPDDVEPDAEATTAATAVSAQTIGDAEVSPESPAADVCAVATTDSDDDNHDAPAGSAEGSAQDRSAAYGDAAYGSGELVAALEAAGVGVMVKVQPPVAPHGRFAKDRFAIDLKAGTVICPAQVTTPIRFHPKGGGIATFGTACAVCPLVTQCTSSANGRTVNIGPYEDELVRARATQTDPTWLNEPTCPHVCREAVKFFYKV